MFNSTKVLVALAIAWALQSAVAEAQIRDAASKASGNYSQFDQSRPAYAPAAPVTGLRDTAPAQAPSENRAFSYEAPKPLPSRAPAQRATKPEVARQPAPPQAVRRYSYEPRYFAPQPRWSRDRSYSAVRDAGSKANGDY